LGNEHKNPQYLRNGARPHQGYYDGLNLSHEQACGKVW